MILVVYDKLFKIIYFMATAEELVRLFRNNNIWKLHGLFKSVIFYRGLYFYNRFNEIIE